MNDEESTRRQRRRRNRRRNGVQRIQWVRQERRDEIREGKGEGGKRNKEKHKVRKYKKKPCKISMDP